MRTYDRINNVLKYNTMKFNNQERNTTWRGWFTV